MRTRWFRGASGIDFSWILESLWEAVGHIFSFVGLLERGLKFDEFWKTLRAEGTRFGDGNPSFLAELINHQSGLNSRLKGHPDIRSKK